MVKNIKQATAPSLWFFKINNEKLPRQGDLNIITDWNKIPQAIILTTKFAQREVEGDKYLAYWRKVHKAYHKEKCKVIKKNFLMTWLLYINISTQYIVKKN